jgi:TolB-like protein/class 3 adenylate cyclase/Tfp pilus assembly protein PilF
VVSDHGKRRLAAILVADVAGYSRLMAEDEQATMAALDAARAVFRARIEANQGRVIDMAGDSVLAAFETATGAVEAAVEIQKTLGERSEGTSDDRPMRFRIGLHLGEIIEKADGTIYGDGVNIAARIQSIAEPGGVSVSDALRGAVRGKVSAAFEEGGEHQLKNIAEPVRVFRIVTPTAIAATPPPARDAPSDAAPALPDRPSIAVLPFTNMSGDPEQGYFADGMVEDIITALARFKELFVIARNSTFVYQGRAVDVQLVARELGVRYVLEGSVRKSGNRVRITGQLIEAATRSHLWAGNFDGALEDLFDLQDRMTVQVVGAIAPSIHQAEIERARRKPPADLVAYDYVLRGAAHIEANAPDRVNAGIKLMQEALRFDTHYALAHGYLAHAYEQRWARFGQAAADKEATERHARAAIAHAGDDAAALAMAGFALGVIGVDESLSTAALDKSVTINPNSVQALGFSAVFHARLGHAEIALDHARKALRLSPLDPQNYGPYTALAVAHFSRGEFAEAASWARKSSETNPRFPVARFWLVAALAMLGERTAAATELARMNALFPDIVGHAIGNLDGFQPELRERAIAAFAMVEAEARTTP